MRHKIKYAKSGQVINVIFKPDRQMFGKETTPNDNVDDEDDALIIKFARKTNN